MRDIIMNTILIVIIIILLLVAFLLSLTSSACEVGSPAWRAHDDSVRADVLRRLGFSVEQAGEDDSTKHTVVLATFDGLYSGWTQEQVWQLERELIFFDGDIADEAIHTEGGSLHHLMYWIGGNSLVAYHDLPDNCKNLVDGLGGMRHDRPNGVSATACRMPAPIIDTTIDTVGWEVVLKGCPSDCKRDEDHYWWCYERIPILEYHLDTIGYRVTAEEMRRLR